MGYPCNRAPAMFAGRLAALILTAAMVLTLAAPLAFAQAQSPPDGVTGDRFSTPETQRLSQQINESESRYDANEQRIEELEEDFDYGAERDRLMDANAEMDESTPQLREELVQARVDAIRSSGAPPADQVSALETLEAYAEDELDYEATVNSGVSEALASAEEEQRDAEAAQDSGSGAPSGSSESESGEGLPWGDLLTSPAQVLALIGIALMAVLVAVIMLAGWLGIPLGSWILVALASAGGALYGLFKRSRRSRRAVSTEGLHTVDHSAPAVTVRQIERPERSIGSVQSKWHILDKDYDVEHVVMHAASGSGKNQGGFNEAAWNIIGFRDESAVLMDPKADLLNEFLRHAPGEQFVYSLIAPNSADEEAGRLVHNSSSALNLVATPELAEATAAALYPIEGAKQPIFPQGARRAFTALAEVLGYDQTNILEIYEVLQDEELIKKLEKKSPRLRRAFSMEGENFRGSVLGTATIPLSPLENWRVARAFVPEPGALQIDFRTKQTAYICMPSDPASVDALGPLAGALVAALYSIATNARRGTRFLIDEAASFLTIEHLASYMSLGRGQGVRFLLVLQDVSQLYSRLGKERAEEALGNPGLHIFGGTSSAATANYLADRSGTVMTRRYVYEDEPGMVRTVRRYSGTAEYDVREEERQGIRPEHVRELEQGSFIAWERGAGLAELVHTVPWYEYAGLALGEAGTPQVVGLGPERRPVPEPRQKAEPEPQPEPDPPANDQGQPEPTAEPEQPTNTDTQPDDHPEVPDYLDMPTCPSCGYTATPDAKFCADCGGRL